MHLLLCRCGGSAVLKAVGYRNGNGIFAHNQLFATLHSEGDAFGGGRSDGDLLLGLATNLATSLQTPQET